MAQTIKLKRSATQNAVPSTSSLALGELAINTYDGKLFIKKNVSGTESIVTIGEVGAGSIGPTELASTAVTAGSYGSTSAIPVITIDADGRITSASTAAISGLSADSVTATEIAANAVGISELNVSDGTNGQVLSTNGSGTLSFVDQSGGAASATAFSTNIASGDGNTTAFTLSESPSAESKIIAFINGVFQNQDAYTISGTTLTFDTAPISGTNNVVVYVVGDVYSGESVLISNFSGNGTTTAFTLSNNPGNENNTQVYIDGVYQQKTTYSVSGTTLTFSSAPPTGTNNIEVVMLTSTTVNTPAAGSVVTASMADDSVTASKIVSSAVTTAKIADSNVTTAKIADDAVTIAKIADAALVIESEGIGSNDNDTTLPTSAAVKDYVDTQVAGKDALSELSGDTDDVTEGSTNLYYTDARVGTYISGNRTYGNITTTGYLAGPSTFTIDPAAVGDNTGTLVIAGNLQVDGTTTTINSTTLTVDDKRITLASGSLNAAAADGAGIEVEISGATYPSIKYDGTNDEWDFNKPINLTGDGHDLVINSADYELVLLGNRGSTGVNLDKAYLRMKAEGTNTVVIDTAGNSYFNGGNVGIGTTSPSSALHVTSTTANINGMVRFQNNMDNNYETLRIESLGDYDAHIGFFADGSSNYYWGAGVDYSDSGKFKIANDNLLATNTRLTIDTSGNVGIGDSNPSFALDVNNTSSRVRFKATTGDSNLELSSIAGRDYLVQSLSGGSFRIYDEDASSTRLTIDSSGNVGIGTSSPNTTLTLSDGTDEFDFGVTTNQLLIKSVTSDGSDDQRIIIDAGNGGLSSTRGAYIALSGNEASSEAGKAIYQMGNVTGSAHIFRKAGGDDAVSIDSSGNVGIGATPSSTIRNDITSAEKALQIGNRAMFFSDGGVTTDLQNNSHLTNSDTRVAMQTDLGSLYQQYQGVHKWFNAASVSAGAAQTMTERMRIDSSGNVKIGTGSPSFYQGSGLEIERAGITTVRLQNTSSGKSVELSQDSDFKIETLNSSMDIVLYPTGNVGVGHASGPDYKLDVLHSGGALSQVVQRVWNNNTSWQAESLTEYYADTYSTTFPRTQIGFYRGDTGDNNSSGFIVKTGTTLANQTTNFKVQADGKVSVGHSSPDSTLHIKGTGQLDLLKIERASSTPGITFVNGADTAGTFGFQLMDNNEYWAGVYDGSNYNYWFKGNSSVFRVEKPVASSTDSGTRQYSHLCTGSFYQGTGAIVINTNIPAHNASGNANMFSIKIRGFQYSDGGQIDMNVGCYAGEGAYYSATYGGAHVPSQWVDEVHFAENTSTDTVAIILGTTSSSIDYEIAVVDFIQGFQNVNESYAEDWTMTSTTDLSGYGTITDCSPKRTVPVEGYHAYLTSSTTLGSGVINLSSTGLTASYNRGNRFNASNGRFTASQDGVYHFDMTVMGASSNTALTYLSAEARVNGGTRYIGGWFGYNSTATQYKAAAGSVTIPLDSGDYVEFYMETSASYQIIGGNAGYTYISGIKIA